MQALGDVVGNAQLMVGGRMSGGERGSGRRQVAELGGRSRDDEPDRSSDDCHKLPGPIGRQSKTGASNKTGVPRVSCETWNNLPRSMAGQGRDNMAETKKTARAASQS